MKRTSILLKVALMSLLSLAALGLTACKGNVEAREHTVTSAFENIDVVTDVTDVTFLTTEDAECRVVASAHKKVTHTAEVVDNTLKISVSDSRNWFEKLFTPKMSVTVYLPKSEYKGLTVKNDTGDVSVKCAIKFGNATITTDTGDVTAEGIVCNAFTAKVDTGDVTLCGIKALGKLGVNTDTGDVVLDGCEASEIFSGTSTGDVRLSSVKGVIVAASTETGDITLENTIAEGKFDIVSDTGDVKFTACDAASVFVTTDTGDVTGSFLTDKVIFADTDTGDVEIPKLTSGDRCEITTDTGDIKITIAK